VTFRPQTPAAALDAWARRHPWACTAAFAAAYVAAGWIGRASRLPDSPLALVWPAAAVGFAWTTLTWNQPQRRAQALLGLAAAAAAVNWATGATPAMTVVFAIANPLQAAGSTWALRRMRGEAWRLRTPADLGVVVAACVAGSAASSVIGPVGIWLTNGGDLAATAGAWALRNATSTFVFGALLFRLADRSAGAGRLPARRLAELGAAAALLSIGYVIVFGQAQGLPLAFLLLPLSLLIALRFSATVAAGHVWLAGALVVAQTLAGNGPFLDAEPATQVLLAQAYVTVVGLVALSLALFRDDRQRLIDRLHDEQRALEAQRAEAVRHATLLQTFLDTVEVGVVACDAAGHLTLFNRTTRQFHGMPEDPELDPTHWAGTYSLYAEDGTTPLAAHEVPLYRVLAEGPVSGALIAIAREGLPVRIVRCDGRRLVDPDGRILGAIVAMTDVTAVRQAARLLAEREAFTRVLLDTVQTAIVACDEADDLTYVNRVAGHVYGLPEDLDTTAAAAEQRLHDAATAGFHAFTPTGEPLPLHQLPDAARPPRGRRDRRGRRRTARAPAAHPARPRSRVPRPERRRARRRDGVERHHSDPGFGAALPRGVLRQPLPIAHLDPHGRVQDTNAALRRFLAQPARRLAGTPLDLLAHPADRPVLRRALTGTGTGSAPVEVRLVRIDGAAMWCEVGTTATADLDGQPFWLVQVVDVHARKTQEIALEAAARRDPLTGLANRDALTAQLQAALDPHTGTGALVMFLDLDGFKQVNDVHGHEAGDAVLVEVARRLVAAVRPADLVARLGGDEFVIVTPLHDRSDGLAARIGQVIDAPIHHAGVLLRPGVSVGVATGSPGDSAADILDRADREMYRAKRQRRSLVPSILPRGREVPAQGRQQRFNSSVSVDLHGSDDLTRPLPSGSRQP
jgi:diguanylate cyclase (GGDEF)-like protein/PAS domain S-box-containing protein